MHRCAAKCCDNSTDSIQSGHRCGEQCGLQLHSAQSHIQKEFEHLQVYIDIFLLYKISLQNIILIII